MYHWGCYCRGGAIALSGKEGCQSLCTGTYCIIMLCRISVVGIIVFMSDTDTGVTPVLAVCKPVYTAPYDHHLLSTLYDHHLLSTLYDHHLLSTLYDHHLLSTLYDHHLLSTLYDHHLLSTPYDTEHAKPST